MQLRQVRDGTGEEAIGLVFSDAEQQCLEKLLPQLEGKTLKQQDPHSKERLGWGMWVINRLGGWVVR